jgi:repressor LexA
MEGDFVIVRRQSDADPGDIVVAMVEEEATVKRFFVDGDRVRLQPENPTIEPSVFNTKDVIILGKVIALHREM